MILPLLSALALAAPCESPATVQQLMVSLGDAEVAFASMDEGGFAAATTHADQLLSCLSETLTPPDAAAWHRVEGLEAFLAGQAQRASLHFGASRALQPAYRLPTSIAPEGHPLRTAFEQAPTAAEYLRVGSGDAAWLVVDGRRSETAPVHRPSVVQWVGDDGSIQTTRVVAEASELPAPAEVLQPVVQPEPPEAPQLPPAPRSTGMGLKVGLGTVTAASAVGSLVALGVASHNSSQFWDATSTPDQIETYRNQANRFTLVSAGLGAAALAGGATLVLTW